MASYDYRCRDCDTVFTVQRSMSDVATPVVCPAGHDDATRVWSAVSLTGKASAAPSAGGCCGGGCCG